MSRHNLLLQEAARGMLPSWPAQHSSSTTIGSTRSRRSSNAWHGAGASTRSKLLAEQPSNPELIEQEWVRDALGPILLPRDVRHLLDISAARLTERRSKQHNIFAVPTASGRLYVYPAYQFDLDEKRLLRAVPSTVQRLLPLTTDLQLAVWFASSNDKIDRREPRELLDEPDQLEPAVAAAEYRWSH